MNHTSTTRIGSLTPKELMRRWRNDKTETPFFSIEPKSCTSLPREETFSDMLTYTLFSTYKFQSLTTVMVVLNSIIYLSTLAYSGIASGGFLLEPKQEALFDFGMNYAYYTLRERQIHRIYLSLFLYCNFVHFFACQIAWVIYGSYVEKLVGWKMLWMVGAIAGVGGILISSCLTPWPHVNGSSPPGAYIGFLLSYLIVKWDKWNYSGSGRWQMLGWLAFGGFILFYQCTQYILDDEIAILVLGSIMVGFLCCLAQISSIDKETPANDHKCTSYLSIGIIVVYYIATIVFFIKETHPTRLTG